MNPKPKKRYKKMTIFLGAIALLFALWAVYHEVWRVLHPPQPEVVDLCDPADKTLSAQAAQQCHWVIPAKYVSERLEQSKGRFFEAEVPMADIDPTYPGDPKNTVIFQFWLGSLDYAGGIRSKKEKIGANQPDEQGLLWLRSREQIYFQGFDGIEVYVLRVPNFSMPLPHARIYRPLSPSGDMHWMVPFPPKLESQEAMDSYVQHNIKEIDRKLMQFISQWH